MLKLLRGQISESLRNVIAALERGFAEPRLSDMEIGIPPNSIAALDRQVVLASR
jgi:hypothetical protein